jgi:hypothetical protein
VLVERGVHNISNLPNQVTVRGVGVEALCSEDRSNELNDRRRWEVA